MIWYNTDCKIKRYVSLKTKYIDNMKDLIVEYLKPEPQNRRRKRGVLDFVGEISEI
jgi:hypothetical protein